jgi:two-component system chemotaxis response regulator CheY
MLSEILHVEDDASLRALVDLSFEGFGFHGKTVTAESVAEAVEDLDDAEAAGETFDLIICDMNLPDGTGLDIVRYVRASDTWRSTPVLILSSDADPRRVGRAYALGANAYIDKSAPGRTLIEVLRSLYDHWAKDVLIPQPLPPDRLQRYIAQSMVVRAQYAQMFQRIGAMFADDHEETAFWLSRALYESNLINLLKFLHNKLEARELTENMLEAFERMQESEERTLTRAEAAVQNGRVLMRDEAYMVLLDIMTAADVELLARAIGHLFPVMPVAMDALRGFFFGNLNEVVLWLDAHATDPIVRERSAALREAQAKFTPRPSYR